MELIILNNFIFYYYYYYYYYYRNLADLMTVSYVLKIVLIERLVLYAEFCN